MHPTYSLALATFSASASGIEMNRRMRGDVSLNVPLNEEDDSIERQDRLVEEGFNAESRLAENEESKTRRRALGMALTALDDRERHIFEARRLIDPPFTLDELAIGFRISSERVRRIEVRAFQKVQRAAHLACARRRDSLTTHGGNAHHGSIAQAKHEQRERLFEFAERCPVSQTLQRRSVVLSCLEEAEPRAARVGTIAASAA
jgi:RNA polymerase sigma factor (sigma-70 family)